MEITQHTKNNSAYLLLKAVSVFEYIQNKNTSRVREKENPDCTALDQLV